MYESPSQRAPAWASWPQFGGVSFAFAAFGFLMHFNFSIRQISTPTLAPAPLKPGSKPPVCGPGPAALEGDPLANERRRGVSKEVGGEEGGGGRGGRGKEGRRKVGEGVAREKGYGTVSQGLRKARIIL